MHSLRFSRAVKLLLIPGSWMEYFRWSNFWAKILFKYAFPVFGDKFRKWATADSTSTIVSFNQVEKIITARQNLVVRKSQGTSIFSKTSEFYLKYPFVIVAYDCICRSVHPKACEPKQACIIIGKKVTDFLLEYRPKRTRVLTPEQTIQIVKNHRKNAGMNTVSMNSDSVNICNDCKCCCGHLEMLFKYNIDLLDSSGYVSIVNHATCIGCGACVKVCPFNAIRIAENKAQVNWDRCMGCGICVEICPQNALSLTRDEKKGRLLEIVELQRLPPITKNILPILQ
jgi:Pyruvate/2-oxoacid:ferredoxin oxidoreductase delta subunit